MTSDNKKIQKKDKGHKQKKSGFTNTIKASLIISLLLAAAAIMIVCFTISANVLNAVKKNALDQFYTNTFDAAVQNRSKHLLEKLYAAAQNSTSQNQAKSVYEEMLLLAQDKPGSTPINYIIQSNQDLDKFLNEMNEMLTSKFAVSDIYIANELNQDNTEKNFRTIKDKNSPLLKIIEKDLMKMSKETAISNKSHNAGNIAAIAKYTDDKEPKLLYTAYLVLAENNFNQGDNLKASLTASFLIIIIIFSICVTFFVNSIITPLNTMEQTVSRIARGDLSGRLDYTKYEEINKLARAYNMMASALQKLYSSLEAQVNDRTRELKKAYAELQNTQAMMVHSEKMKSLGELVAGIMHEINNPINFIYGNMTHLDNYSKDLIAIIDEYTKFEASLSEDEKKQLEEMKKECDYEFLKTDMPDLIKSCKEGADRAKNIIQDLKSFSRMEEVSIRDVDIPAEIDTVLNILHNKLKNKAQIHKEYMNSVPKVEAFGGQLNQVFMNILDNAAGAIEKSGDIWIRINSGKTGKNLVIEIEDNGAGMDEETARKVFDPFFTTKPVGKGTGLGMSITYKIIKNHQGDIRVESTKGKGSKFIVTLPLNINRENLKTAGISGEEEKNG